MLRICLLSLFLLHSLLRSGENSAHVSATKGGPSALIDGCVATISGSFYIDQADHVVKGYVPTAIPRIWLSSSNLDLHAGWGITPHVRAKSIGDLVFVREPDGTPFIYCWDSEAKAYTLHYSCYSHALTNVSKGLISARSNPMNNRIEFDGDDFTLYGADGSQRKYKDVGVIKHGQQKTFQYVLEREQHPNGFVTHYKFDATSNLLGYKDKILKIEQKDPTDELTFSHANFHYYDQSTDHPKMRIKTSDSRQIEYKYKKFDNGIEERYKAADIKNPRVLKSVNTPENGLESIKYRFQDKFIDPLVNRLNHQNCPMQVEYYTEGKVHLNSIEPDYKPEKIKPKSPLRGRVKHLKLPLGNNGSFQTTKTFTYHLVDPESTDPKAHGWTNVYDAQSNLTTYRYTTKYRLYQKEVLDSNNERYLIEHTTWDGERLKANTLLNPDLSPFLGYIYKYDRAGNIIEEKLWGNITGLGCTLYMECPQTILAEPSEISGEIATTKRTFTTDNLIKTETTPNGLTIEYSYFKNTDLISAKYFRKEDVIVKRQFYVYDEHHTLTEEYEDDGTAYQLADLTDVTLRRLKKTVPYLEGNFIGLPKTIQYGYLDLTAQKPIWLRQENRAYTPHGDIRAVEVIDANDHLAYTLHYVYDERSRLITEMNPLGDKAEYKYDEHNNCIYEKGFDGTEIHRTFDACNRCIESTTQRFDTKAQTMQFKYNHRHELIRKQDHLGNTTKYKYDVLGNLIETLYPNGSRSQKGYDIAGNVIWEIDCNGNKTQTSYNAYGKPIKILYPDGSKTSFTYYLSGNLQTKISANGARITYTYDVFDRKIKEVNAYPSRVPITETTYEYDAFNLIKKVDPAGNITLYTYDGAGRKIGEESHFDNKVEKTTFEYDALGRQNKTIYHADKNTLIEYKILDSLGQTIEEQQLGINGTLYKKTCYGYDKRGNKITTTRYGKENQSTEQDTYDAFDRLILHTDPLGNATKTEYIETKQLTKITTNPKGLKTIETYDALNNLTSTTLQDTAQTLHYDIYTYDLNNNKTSHTATIYPDSTRQVTSTWAYDAKNRVITLTEAHSDPIARTTYTTYTPNGQIASITKPSGIIIENTYDYLDRLTHVKSSDQTIDYVYAYNKLSQIIAVHDKINNSITTRKWDPKGRLLYEKLANDIEIENTYDLRGRRISCTIPTGHITFGYNPAYLTTVTRYDAYQPLYTHTYDTFDLSGNPLTATTITNDAISYDYTAGLATYITSPHYIHEITKLDPNNNVLVATDNNTQETYQYNQLDQLILEQNAFTNTYAYDSNHNRLLHNDTSAAVNALNQLSHLSYGPDGNPQLPSKTLKYDALGRLIEIDDTQYIYDFLNRRTTSKTFCSTKHFLYDDKNEIGATNTCQSLQELRILGTGQGAEIGAAIAIELHDQIYAPLHDLYGNVKMLISQNGSIFENYTYDAFGNHTTSRPFFACHSNPWRFQSKRLDPTGLINFGRRYYDPTLGRFLTPDPLGLGEHPNLYQYLHGNPLLHYDEYGLFGCYPQAAMRRDLRSRSQGFAHACVDQVRNMYQDAHSLAYYSGSFDMSDTLMDYRERKLMDSYHYRTQARQASLIDHNVQSLLNIDPMDQTYMASRKWSNIGINTAVLVYSSYGLAKSIVSMRNNRLINLYRAVKPKELAHIQETGMFCNLGHAEGKYFTTSIKGASSYAKQAVQGFSDPPYALVRTQASHKILNGLTSAQVDKGIPAWVIPDESLNTLVPEIMSWMAIPE